MTSEPTRFACRTCGNAGRNQAWVTREMVFGTGEEFTIVECGSCGSLQLRDVPEDLAPYYPARFYRQERSLIATTARRLRDGHLRRGRGIGRFIATRFPVGGLEALRNLGLARDARILDVGTGAGSFLVTLAGLGFRNLVGIDPFLAADANLDGIRLRRRTIFDMDGRWDLIVFNHSLEHILEQRETMATACALLDQGGACLVRMPVVSWAWERYRTSWIQLDPPRHSVLHRVSGFERLASDAGLAVVDTQYDSTDFQFWGSELAVLGIPLYAGGRPPWRNARRVLGARTLASFRRQAAALNAAGQGDQACFLLRPSRG